MASSKRSAAPASSSKATSRAPRTTATSSPTRSTSRPELVVIALGSNLGPREMNLKRAIEAMKRFVRIVRISSMHDTEPVDAPPPRFLNMVVAGLTTLSPRELLAQLNAIEVRMGRVRRQRNAPRTIDLDLILYGATLMRSRELTLPHPRYLQRSFVMDPLRELKLPWRDPASGTSL